MSDEQGHQLLRLDVGDDPAAWAEAGFTVVEDEVRVGSTTVRLHGASGDRGILGAAIDGITESLDGLPVSPPIPSFKSKITPVHANLAVGLDHIVAMSSDMDRTIAALSDAGLVLRRTRLFESGGETNRQAFFWLGDVILELAGNDAAHGPDPAIWWGLAFTCPDLEQAGESLNGRLGNAKDAVQPGRRIAGLHTAELGISVPTVFMTPHPPTDGPGSGDGYLR